MAAARAEARRKAILSRGSDRLSKLTSSARGGEDASYLQQSVSNKPSISSFIGDDPPELPLPDVPPNERSSWSVPPVDSSVWSADAQAEIMRALSVGAAANNANNATRLPPRGVSQPPFSNDDPSMDFLNALMAASPPEGLSPSPGASSVFSSASAAQNVSKPKTLLQKFLPLVHILCVWLLLGFFVLWREPTVYNVNVPWESDSDGGIWRRWGELVGDLNTAEHRVFSVQSLPFLWAFITLELVLFSFRVFFEFDPISPPTIIAFVLPLPPQFSSMILNVLRYLQMFGILLDDLAALLVGIGFMVYLSHWLAS